MCYNCDGEDFEKDFEAPIPGWAVALILIGSLVLAGAFIALIVKLLTSIF